MTDSHMPHQSADSARSDATAVMPPVTTEGQPQISPQATPPKRGMPAWAWALVGAVVVLLLFGAFAVGRGVKMRQNATEATATVAVESSTAAGTGELAAPGDSVGDAAVTEDPAASDSGGSGSSGDSASSGGSASDASSSGDSAAGDSGADAGASSDPPIGDAGGDEAVFPEYRSVLKTTGTREYVSAPIRLERGRMELTIHVTRTTHHPMAAQVQRSGGTQNTWWSTGNAVDGMTQTVEMNVPATASYRFRVNCDPGSGWSLRVRWKS